jgi:thiamine biosynthesis lipoprotein
VNRVEQDASFGALGTTAVVLVAEPGHLEVARAAVEREIDEVDRTCSRFRPDSELLALNAAGGEPFAVSPTLAEAVAQALRAAALTDGLVDPTMGHQLRDLGYDRDFRSVPPDGPPIVVTLRRAATWSDVQVDSDSDSDPGSRAGTTRITLPEGIELDLGATAKAWCADRAASAAFAATGVGVLVGLGGDLAVAGPAPDDGWPVRVADDHAAGPEAPGEDVLLATGGLATSSTTVRHWSRGSDELHHVLDPATGRPAEICWRTASVAAGSCLDANIASTASLLLGPLAPGWLAERDLPARLVRPDGSVVLVGGWPTDGGATP